MNQALDGYIPGRGYGATVMLGFGQRSASLQQAAVSRYQEQGLDHLSPEYRDVHSYATGTVDVSGPPSVSAGLPVGQYVVEACQEGLYQQPVRVARSHQSAEENVDLVVKPALSAYSPSLDILQRSQLAQEGWTGCAPTDASQIYLNSMYGISPGETGALGQIIPRVGYPGQPSIGDAPQLGYEGVQAKALCTFFVRTGTCAYGDRCKFKHPQDRPPPQLNSRGYPLRPGEPECAHYLKKGWCAFGQTCKFNHPEVNAVVPYAYSAQSPYVSYGSAYNVPSMYYVPSVPQPVNQVREFAVASYQGVAPATARYRPSPAAIPMQVVAGQDSVPRVEQLARAMQTLQLGGPSVD